MSSPAGSGSEHRSIGRLLTSVWCLCILAATATAEEREYRLLTEVALDPGERLITFVRQGGADLIVEVESGGDVLFVQDAPDLRYGTEVVALANDTTEARQYRINIAQKYGAVEDEPSFEVIEFPDTATFDRARVISDASVTWHTGANPVDAIAAWAGISGDDELADIASFNRVRGLIMTARYQQAIDVVDAIRDDFDTGSLQRTYLEWLRADCLSSLRRHADAIAQFETIIDDLHQLGDSLETELIRHNILADYGHEQVLRGFQSNDVAMMHPGAETIEDALATVTPYNDLKMNADLTVQLAMYYAMSGDWELGLNTLYVAHDIYEEAGSPISLITVKSNMGYHHLRLGQLGEALQYYREALQMKRDRIYEDGLAIIYARLGLIYKKMGEYYKSGMYYDLATGILQELGLEEQLLDAELELGAVQRLQGDVGTAVATHRNLMDRISREGWNDGWIRLNVALARDYLALGEVDRAKHYVGELREHRARENAGGNAVTRVPGLELDIAMVSARLALAQDKPQVALEEARTALAGLGPLDESERQLEVRHLQSVAYNRLGDLERALATGTGVLQLLDAVRQQVDVTRLAATFGAGVEHVTDYQVAMRLEAYLESGERKYFNDAFDILQQSRAISLRESENLSKVRARRQRDRHEIERLWQEMLADKRAVLAAVARDESTGAMEEAMLRSEEAYRTYRSGVLDQRGSLYFASLHEVQAQLTNETALTFVLGSPRSYRIAITRDGFDVYRLPSEAALSERVNASIDELTQSRTGVSMDATRALTRLLIPNRVQGALLVEADGVLNRIPFSALEHDGEPLVSNASVVNVPSLSAYLEPKRVASGARERLQLVVLADPAFENTNAPLELASANRFDQWRDSLDRLPYTAVEAEKILSRLPEADARLFKGASASIRNLMSEEVRSARMLHLASHGFASDSNPNGVGFLLAREAQESNGGFLTVEEILTRRFETELLVISGCDTARGEILAGEGMMGLSRAFLAQGSKAVLATLWPISDRASATFMDYFYEALIAERSAPAEALRTAQNRMRATPRYRSPYYWAAFSLYVRDRNLDVFPEGMVARRHD